MIMRTMPRLMRVWFGIEGLTINLKSLKWMQLHQLVEDLPYISVLDDVCASFHVRKMHRKYFPINKAREQVRN